MVIPPFEKEYEYEPSAASVEKEPFAGGVTVREVSFPEFVRSFSNFNQSCGSSCANNAHRGTARNSSIENVFLILFSFWLVNQANRLISNFSQGALY
jgi:hypothetical protein